MIRSPRLLVPAVVLALFAWPVRVYADGWPLQTSACVVCGYAETYQRADGTLATHRGLDIEAEPGDEVFAVCPGTVVFAGSVPGQTGGTILAVTVENDAGERWSYLPIERVSVTAGARVAEGDALGRVAASGDVSSAGSHLHLGLRHGDDYADPTERLTAPVILTEEPAATPRVEPATEPEPALSSGAIAAISDTVEVPVSSIDAATDPNSSAVAAHAGSAEVAPLASGEALAGAPADRILVHPGMVAGGAAPRSRISIAAPQMVSTQSESSGLLSSALLGIAGLAMLAFFSSVQAFRDRIAVLWGHVAAVVSR